MKLVRHPIGDVVVEHLRNGCFQVFNHPKSQYITSIPLYISANQELYGVSLSIYNALKHQDHKYVICVVISETYDEKVDLFLHNNHTNTVLKLHQVRDNFKEPSDVEDCEFDHNQLDLMYKIDLNDDDAIDIRKISEESAKIKKNFDVMILTKTLEENFLIQRFFDINNNVITHDHFMKKLRGHSDFMSDMFGDGRDDSYYQEHIYSDYTIKCKSIEEMNEVLDGMKLNHAKLKTVRINFNKVRKIFE